MKKIGVFIPGRLSSERLPNKLVLPLGESSLWEIACKKLNSLSETYNKYALCYDDELIDIAKKYPNIKIIKRSKETAEAEGPLSYIFKEMKDVEDTHLMFLNPCLYNLSKESIEKSLDTFLNSDHNYATSVKKFQNWLWNNDGDNLTNIDFKRLTTKEIKGYYQAAHCFHIFDKDKFFKDNMMLKNNHGLIEVPYNETLDVDTLEDYEYAKFKLAKKYVIDIDGTICFYDDNNDLNYNNAKPYHNRINRINKLYDAGNTIIFATARGYETGINWREITEKQLKEWNVKYHELHFGKPSAYRYIDDKGVSAYEFFK